MTFPRSSSATLAPAQARVGPDGGTLRQGQHQSPNRTRPQAIEGQAHRASGDAAPLADAAQGSGHRSRVRHGPPDQGSKSPPPYRGSSRVNCLSAQATPSRPPSRPGQKPPPPSGGPEPRNLSASPRPPPPPPPAPRGRKIRANR